MPREEFPRCRREKDGVGLIGTRGEKESLGSEEKERAIRIKGAAIEP